MRDDLSQLKSELEVLRKENASLKVDASRGNDLKSAMQSNEAAVADKIESANRLVKEKEQELSQIKDRNGQLEMETA